MYIDNHTHSQYSGDIPAGRGSSVRELCLAAEKAGLAQIAVTDHCDIDGIIDGYFVPLDHESVMRDVIAAKEEFAGRVKVLFGIELGQGPHKPAESRELLAKYPYDIVLGSVHAVRGITDFSDTDLIASGEKGRRELWEKYIEELLETIAWGEFDVLTHITYPKRYYLKQGIADFPDIAGRGREYFGPVLRAVIENGITLECNSSGLRQIMGECLPNRDLLEYYYELGGRDITVGSDAHRASDVGAGLKETYGLLSEVGFKYVTAFENRVKKYERI
ncbi:MAG: histidinol-phosphatase HisJ family protein [Clostridia bacterium]|nr:histidinol-phosphatase HisJ family protein [Clostridia bacterium]